jgi:hypothetical protein
MHPAGLAKVEQAKADGSWNALDRVAETARLADRDVCANEWRVGPKTAAAAPPKR